MSEELKHIGTPRHSGRYPWGSGGDPYQRSLGFRSHILELQKQGFSLTEIAELEGIKTPQLRTRISMASAEIRAADTAQAARMKDLGYSYTEIGRRMGKNESSIRNLLDPVMQERAAVAKATENMLKSAVDKERYIDIGMGIESDIGVGRTKINVAVANLVEQGYKIHYVHQDQLGMPGKFTNLKVLGAPDTDWKEVVNNHGLIKSLVVKSEDYGRTFNSELGIGPIQSVDSKRINVKYAKEGGNLKDGVIELRPGASDLDLGGSKYAQVRIAVDGSHYLKGMAIYNKDPNAFPPGVDIIFNTNKNDSGNKLDALKSLKSKDGVIDKDNPFKSTIKVGGKRGALNVVNEEGDWEEWSKTLSSQFLSKQTAPLAKAQLALSLKQKQQEYDEIMSLTNPVVRKQLLESFADDCDSSSVHLKAASMPRQAQKVILPIPGLKENEIYAPSFNDGEPVVLIRHPHGGRFEIPQLIVNNKSKAAKDIMDRAVDAVGINPKVAVKLSGADFDGDTVIVIPNSKGLVKTEASLKGLKNFDPISAYPAYPGMPKVASKNDKWPAKQQQMGTISNLITDMTIKGANSDDIAKAVRHSMVIIDAEKHNLNYKLSYKENQIAALSEKYQNSSRGGASTLISKASSEKRLSPQRKEGLTTINPVTGKKKILYVDPKTGEKLYEPKPESYKVYSYAKTDKEKGIKSGTKFNPKGLTAEQREELVKQGVIKVKEVERTSKTTKMEATPDAFMLSSGRPHEEVYAAYANNLKALANTSRLKALKTEGVTYNPSAKIAYANEVASLDAQLNIARRNKPLERNAQIQAGATVKRIKQENPGMDKEEIKKLNNQALAEARVRSGAKKSDIIITDKEWAAIQAGAFSTTKLTEIIQHSDLATVKQLATPHANRQLTSAQVTKATTMLNSGRTQAEVSEALGISVNALSKGLTEAKP